MTAAAARLWSRLTGRTGGGQWLRGLNGMAAAVLAALALVVPVGPAAGQLETPEGDKEKYFDEYELPPSYQPLAVAYLAAPYRGGFTGRAGDFMRAPVVSPGTTISARFLADRMEALWQGIPLGLFKGPPGHATRLTTKGSSELTLGGDKELRITLYAFVPESAQATMLSIKTYESDAWKSAPQRFSVLADTTFVLLQKPDVLSFQPSIVACVNKRGTLPLCTEAKDRGEVIEDPLSGQPALLMLARSPDVPTAWLKAVMTEICVHGSEGHVVRVPDIDQPIYLKQRDGERWCSVILPLDYYALREVGLQLGSDTPRKRLDSWFAAEAEWRMWAGRPKTIKVAGKDEWVQRIILYPPKSAVASATGQKPAAEQGPTSSTFEIAFREQPPAIRRLWYGSLPSGADPKLAKCENQKLVLPLPTQASQPLIEADGVKALKTSRLQVKEPPSKQVNWQLPHALLMERGDGQVFCAVAMPSGKERELTVSTLLPSQTPSETPVAAGGEKEKTTPPAGKDKLASPQTPPSAQPKKAAAVTAGPPVVVVFSSTDKAAKRALSHVGKVENEDGEGVFHSVDRQQLKFLLAPESKLMVSKCEARQLTCRHDGRDIELLPKDGVPLPNSVKQIVVSIDFAPEKRGVELTILREGPALLSIEQVSSKGQVIDRVTGAGPVLQRTVQWGVGDKLRVRPVEPDLQKLSEITIAESPWQVQDDKHAELELKPDGKAATIIIKTLDRLFFGPVTVAARGGKVVVMHGEKQLDLVEDGASAQIKVEGAKHGDTVTVRPANPEYEVARITLRDGQKPAPTVVDLPQPSFTLSLDRSYLRADDKLAALSLEAEIREVPVLLPTDVLLKPAIRLGKALLPLQSCKVSLARIGSPKIPAEHTSKGTQLKFGTGQSVPRSGQFSVEPELGASPSAVCLGLQAEESVPVAKFKEVGADRVLKVALRRPGSRAFVGIVSLSPELRAKERNWRSALEAVKKAFEAANERPMGGGSDRKGKYIWRAVYGPDGSALLKSETADETELPVGDITGNTGTMERLTDGAGLQALDTRLILAGKDVAEFGEDMDMLIVSDSPRATCGWSLPLEFRGSRAVLVRLAGFQTVKDDELKGAPGVRLCPQGKPTGLVAELEVVPGDVSGGVLPHAQLDRAIAEAAKHLFNP